MKVKDIMDTSPSLIRTSDTFEQLIRKLDEVKYRSIFVIDKEDKLVGIVTEVDIIKVLVPKYISFDEFLISAMEENYFEKKCIENKNLTVTDIMTKTVLSVHQDDTVIKAAALMFVNKIHALPVVQEGKIVGNVHIHNLIKHIKHLLAAELI